MTSSDSGAIIINIGDSNTIIMIDNCYVSLLDTRGFCMKKFALAAATMALIASGGAWGETHETLKAHTLSTSVGNISFGAWGRSTFEMGRQNTTSKITVDGIGDFGSVFAAAVDAYNENVGTVSCPTDTTKETYETEMTTYVGAVTFYGATNGYIPAATATAIQSNTEVAKAAALIAALKTYEKNETKSGGYAHLDPDWSYGSRIGFWIIGRTPDEKFGFDFNLDADARALFVHKLYDSDEDADKVNYNEDGKYAVAIGDQAKMWGLFDLPAGLEGKVAFGKMREQTLRGSIGDFGQRESSDVKSEDDIFSEFWPTTGLYVSATGTEDSVLNGFHAAASVDLSGTFDNSSADGDSTENMSFYEAMRTAQAGVGYTIPGIAQIKAQYWGDSISEKNYRYALSEYSAARDAGFGLNDYYGRMEFGVDILPFMGGATSFLDPNLDLEATPNANLIEIGFKVPLMGDNDLRAYDPEKFYNWYSCIGTMGVIQKGFILYKGHIWGGQGESNLSKYTDITNSGSGLITMSKGDEANIIMAGVDALAEVCANPFGKQDVFIGLSANYNITMADADGNFSFSGNTLSVDDLKLRQHNIGAEVYVKKTFAANNYMFVGVADRFSVQTMEGTVGAGGTQLADLSYKATSNQVFMPIGVELFF